MKVAFCTLYIGKKPLPQFIESMEKCLPAVEAAGWEHCMAIEQNCPYISAARAKVMRKALDAQADCIVYLDYDVAWTPEDMVKLLNTEGDVVAGTYRKKTLTEEVYMSVLDTDIKGNLMVRSDGCIKAHRVPAGFLKITTDAINKFATKYPHLLFGPPMAPQLDMFNHGVIDGIWYGEDYAFSKRWYDMGGDMWVVPDLNIDHYRLDGTCYPGNLHHYLLNYKKGDHKDDKA